MADSRETLMVNAFVTGWPVKHSRSPLIHGTWIKAHQVDASYEAIDVAPEALGHFFEQLRGGRNAVLVCGVSVDKDTGAIVERLAPAFAAIICVAEQHKGAPAAVIGAHAQSANPTAEISLAESVADARRLALAKAKGGAVYVAGGLFLAAEFKAVHLGRDPGSLLFF